MIESEKKKIKAEFERKEKQVSIEKRIKQSNLAKDQRMRVLTERDALMKEMMALARQKLMAVTQSQGYSEVLANLIAQSVGEMKDEGKPMTVVGLAKDKQHLQNALAGATQKIKATGRTVSLSVSSEVLPNEDIGGVVVISSDGRTKGINTFKSREESVCVDLLPRFRKLMYGK